MSIVAVCLQNEAHPLFKIDTSSTLEPDPRKRAEAAATLIENLEPVLVSLRQIRTQAVVELAQARMPQSQIAKHVRLTRQHVGQIIKKAHIRFTGVAS